MKNIPHYSKTHNRKITSPINRGTEGAMAKDTSISTEELEKMIANFEWNSDEDSDPEEPYENLSLSINAKVPVLKP